MHEWLETVTKDPFDKSWKMIKNKANSYEKLGKNE